MSWWCGCQMITLIDSSMHACSIHILSGVCVYVFMLYNFSFITSFYLIVLLKCTYAWYYFTYFLHDFKYLLCLSRKPSFIMSCWRKFGACSAGADANNESILIFLIKLLILIHHSIINSFWFLVNTNLICNWFVK